MPATMPPRDLLADLAHRGFTLRAVGGSVSVTPASRLTADDRRAIQERRADLLAILSPAEPWNTTTAIHLISEADGLVERLGVSGQHPEITAAAAMVASAFATRDLETIRFALAEFEATVRGVFTEPGRKRMCTTPSTEESPACPRGRA